MRRALKEKNICDFSVLGTTPGPNRTTYGQGEPMSTQVKTNPKIWAVGGGKGGAGKTAVSSSLAIVLARSGFRCVVVDADFGAANLHTVLGALEPRRSLRDFLAGEVETLDEIACETPIPGLRLVSGSRARVDAANLDHPRRQKLLRHLRKLDADHVIIDLAAGSGFNTLDFFVSADLPLAVVTPEPTAIENTYHFIKASWFRSMRPAAHRPEVREGIRLALGTPHGQRTLSAKLLIETVRGIDPSAAAALQMTADAFRPALVVNRAASLVDRQLGQHIADGCDEALGSHVRAVGGLALDRAVPRAVERRQPVLEIFPNSEFADDIYATADRMLSPASAEPERDTSVGVGLLRRALGLTPVGYEKHQQIRHLAELSSTA
jgi:flagellar biosynthesis protein FlhG